MPLLAIIDDEPVVVSSAAAIARRLGFDVIQGSSIADARDLVASRSPDVLMIDVHLPDGDADAVVQHLRALRPQMRVILFSGDLRLDTSSRAVRAGAYEYLTKPFTLESMAAALQSATARPTTPPEVHRPDTSVAPRRLLGQSPEVCLANLLIERFAKTPDSPILITGESGTGKEVAAAAIHNLSQRRAKPFLKINCAAIPRALMEAELFGHERGSFTDAKGSRIGVLEACSGGTLFLDELGELDLELQPKLLRVLEEKMVTRIGSVTPRPIDVRIVAATNRNLAELCRSGRFREDLYFRLAVLHVDLVPLRQRREDIPLLAEFFLRERGAALGRVFTSIEPETLRRFCAYDWPGNVRELRNLIERLIVLSQHHGILSVPWDEWERHLYARTVQSPLTQPTTSPSFATPRNPAEQPSFPDPTVGIVPLDQAEKNYILASIAALGGNKTAAAKALGIARSTLNRKLESYGASTEDESG